MEKSKGESFILLFLRGKFERGDRELFIVLVWSNRPTDIDF